VIILIIHGEEYKLWSSPSTYVIFSIFIIKILPSAFSSQELLIRYILRFRRGIKFHDAKLRKQASVPYMDTSTCLPFNPRHYPHFLSLCYSCSPDRGVVHSAFLVITGRSQYRNQHGSTARHIDALKLPEDSARDPYFPATDRNMVCHGNVITYLVAAMLVVITVAQAADVPKCKLVSLCLVLRERFA
jgi:hypothetical protein